MIAAVGPRQCAIGKAATAAAVDCTVSSWVVDAACVCTSSNPASCSQSASRTIVTPAKNGGACPSLSSRMPCAPGRSTHPSLSSTSECVVAGRARVKMDYGFVFQLCVCVCVRVCAFVCCTDTSCLLFGRDSWQQSSHRGLLHHGHHCRTQRRWCGGVR